MAAKQKPDSKTMVIQSTISIISMIAWFFIDVGPDLLYGKYGGLILGVLCAIIAVVKSRNPINWFALGSWFVLVSFIILLFLPRLHDRLCPNCREGVASDASICPHCQSKITRDIEAIPQESDKPKPNKTKNVRSYQSFS